MDPVPGSETSRVRTHRSFVPLAVWAVGLVAVVAFWIGVVKLVKYVSG